MTTLKPCVTCGIQHKDLADVLYPINRERSCWKVSCSYCDGGCGRTVYAVTLGEAVAKWDNGLTDTIED